MRMEAFKLKNLMPIKPLMKNAPHIRGRKTNNQDGEEAKHGTTGTLLLGLEVDHNG